MYRASKWGRGICIDTIEIVTGIGSGPLIQLQSLGEGGVYHFKNLVFCPDFQT